MSLILNIGVLWNLPSSGNKEKRAHEHTIDKGEYWSVDRQKSLLYLIVSVRIAHLPNVGLQRIEDVRNRWKLQLLQISSVPFLNLIWWNFRIRIRIRRRASPAAAASRLETAHFPVYSSTSELHIAKPQIIILWGHKIVRVSIFENNY